MLNNVVFQSCDDSDWIIAALSSLLLQYVCCVCSVFVSPTVSRSLLIPRRGFPSNSNTFRLGRRLRDARRLKRSEEEIHNVMQTYEAANFPKVYLLYLFLAA